MVKVDDKVMTEEDFEARQQWASLGGTVATAKGVHSLLMEEAGDYFARGKDDIAIAFRGFARAYEEKVVKPQSAALQIFINGDNR